MKYWKAVKKTNKKNEFQTGGVGGSKEFTFKVGKTYQEDGKPILCKNGFHFYREKDFIFGTTLFGEQTTDFIEVEPLDEVISDTEKNVCCKLKVIRFIPRKEWKKLVKKGNNSGHRNTGHSNSGNCNSGHRNSGNRNSGHWNSGHRNTGDRNSGYSNSGYSNSGDSNSGDYNSGDSNSGYRNSGDRNSGYCNSGDRNSGYYNSGHRNSGYSNSGNWNSGDRNSGYSNSGYRNSGDYNSGYSNSGNWNSGGGYRNYFCKQTRYFLFDTEVSKETIEKVNEVSMSWFSLENKSYKEAWTECPEEVLDQFSSIEEFQTKKAKEIFLEITGRELKTK